MDRTSAFLLLGLALCVPVEGLVKAFCKITEDTGEQFELIYGTIDFSQQTIDENVTINIALYGFDTTDEDVKHGFHVHTTGALGNNCGDAGGHYNPFGNNHGAPTDTDRHVGDLGNIEEDENGNVAMSITDPLVKLSGENSVLGRAIVVHEREDDLGQGGAPDSGTTGAAGRRIGCCIITFTEEDPVVKDLEADSGAASTHVQLEQLALTLFAASLLAVLAHA